MKLGLALSLMLFLGIGLVSKGVIEKHSRAATAQPSKVEVDSTVLPIQRDPLSDSAPAFTTEDRPNVITLEASNTYVFRGIVNGESVGKAIAAIGAMSRRLRPSDNIYLVLDSPGGSVPDGADFSDFLNSIPQKVTTVTIFAASMAFHIVQSNHGERTIVKNGVLMSHRATVGGMDGQLDGEFESRYKMMKRQIDQLDFEAANRMHMNYSAYKAIIKDELWVFGFDAKNQQVADREVAIQCGKSMTGTTSITLRAMFGEFTVNFDNCPLLRAPTGVKVGNVKKEDQARMNQLIEVLFNRPEEFVKTMIINNKYQTVFP